jgi:hypothetical protein
MEAVMQSPLAWNDALQQIEDARHTLDAANRSGNLAAIVRAGNEYAKCFQASFQAEHGQIPALVSLGGAYLASIRR